MFKARKMLAREFKTDSDYYKRLPDGSRCAFAVESEAGATITGLAWRQAVALAEKLTEDSLIAA